MRLEGSEEIVRAICSDKYDGDRISPSAFTGANVSVSRLSIIGLEDQWEVLKKSVQKPPQRMLKLLAQCSVATVEEVGKVSNPPAELRVDAAAEVENPAHAEIRPQVTRGQGNRLKELVTIHELPDDRA